MILTIPHLDLKQIAESGQCFRWKKAEADIVCDSYDAYKSDRDDIQYDTYVIPSYGSQQRDFEPLIIRCIDREKDEFELSCDDVDWNGHWADYLDMDTDYEDVRNRIMGSEDEHAIESYRLGSGIRILKQDTWEMIITFLISQNNNIRRITGSVEEICRRHSDTSSRKDDGSADMIKASCPYFPRPEEFDIRILNDRSLGLGYRAPYIENAVKVFKESDSLLDELAHMSYEEAYDALVGFTGIGPKVANCICLFGLHHIEAFPIDTHVKQLLQTYYPKGFPYEKYEGMAGIVQQYLFYYELKNRTKLRTGQ